MNVVFKTGRKIIPAVLVLLFAACAAVKPSTPVLSGDTVKLSYMCRSADAMLVATSESKTENQSQSSIVIASDKPGPVVLKAGPETKCSTCPQEAHELKGFNTALSASLADAIVGLLYGRHQEIHIAREVPEGLPRGKRYLGLAKVWRRPKRTAMLADDYRKMVGRDPSVGDQYDYEMGLRATVSNVENGHVIISYTPTVALGGMVPTHFGEGIILDGGAKWKIDMQVHKGQLIRNGKLLGRVVEVNPTMFYIDFGHPFGGLELVCDLEIEPKNKN